MVYMLEYPLVETKAPVKEILRVVQSEFQKAPRLAPQWDIGLDGMTAASWEVLKVQNLVAA